MSNLTRIPNTAAKFFSIAISTIAFAGLLAGEADATRAKAGSKREKQCTSRFNSDLNKCALLPTHAPTGIPQSVYDGAIRHCENNAAADYDRCLNTTARFNVPFDHSGEGGYQQLHEDNSGGGVPGGPGGGGTIN